MNDEPKYIRLLRYLVDGYENPTSQNSIIMHLTVKTAKEIIEEYELAKAEV